MDDLFRFADEFGPAKIVHIHEAGAGLKSIVAIDNTACGPAMGGVRMAPDVSVEEAFRLARAMTMKNALAGIPYGGGKAVIFADPAIADDEKERLMRAFAVAIRDLKEYIPGPDMGTNEQSMAWVHDEIGRAIGLPASIGGIPLDEIGATGLGVAVAAEVASRYCQLDLSRARVVIQGFGAVGTHAARLLAQGGARIVGVADISGALRDDGGIDIASLIEHVRGGGVVREFANGAALPRDAIIEIESDIFIPAARPDVITAGNVDKLKTRLVVQGANIPVSDAAEAMLHRRGVLSVPDFVANAGGIICGAVEYQGGTQAEALRRIEQSIRTNTEAVLDRATAAGITPRAAGLEIAEARVRAAMATRRWS